jgi:hypothetical protein
MPCIEQKKRQRRKEQQWNRPRRTHLKTDAKIKKWHGLAQHRQQECLMK